MHLLLVPSMAFLARASGGGLFADRVWSRLPELLFSLPFGYAAYATTGRWWMGMIGWLWSFVAMELGHGTVYGMSGYRSGVAGRIQTIERLVRPIYTRLGGSIYHPLYSWLCMGLKGLLIGLPLGIFAPLIAVLWPAAYWVGHRVENQPEVAEWLSGMFAGLVVFLALP